MEQIADSAGGDDFAGVEEMQGRFLGEVEAVHPGAEAVVDEPGADIVVAELASFDFGAVGSQLGEVHVNNICVGHGKAPFF